MASTIEEHVESSQLIAASPLTSRMVLASMPMTPEQLQEFSSRLSRGWNPVERIKPSTADVPTPRHTSEMMATVRKSDDATSEEASLSEELRRWIAATLDLHAEKDARSHADAAVREFLNPPCSNEELLEFFRAFATAYEKMVRCRCEISNSARSNVSTRMTISQASANHVQTLRRLRRLATMEQERPEAADLFRLSEFAGCAAEELGRYFSVPVNVIAVGIENHTWDIYDDVDSV